MHFEVVKSDIFSDMEIQCLEISTGVDVVLDCEYIDLLCAFETLNCGRGDEGGDGFFDDLDQFEEVRH